MINLPNLLNRNWGIKKFNTTNSPLTYTGIDANGVPSYNLRQFDGKLVSQPYQNATSGTTWSLLLGAKYIF